MRGESHDTKWCISAQGWAPDFTLSKTVIKATLVT